MTENAAPQARPRELFYERIDTSKLADAIRLRPGERLLVLQPFGWHIDGHHIPNAAEQFTKESVCEEHGWEIVIDGGDYIAIVKPIEPFTPADAAGTPNEEEAYPMVACPVCAVEQQDLDGFGVLHCFACGYCSHPSRDGGVCGLCGHREYEAGDAGGSEDRDWFARQAARTAEDIKQLPDWLKTPKDAAGTPRE
jgi:hypothetical protein